MTQPHDLEDLERTIARLAADPAPDRDEARHAFERLRTALTLGSVRAARRDPGGRWRPLPWVKAGILLGFRVGRVTPVVDPPAGPFAFQDKDTLPLRRIPPGDGVRIVPGGSAIRDGSYLGPGVICLPPMYVNVGAYLDEGAMVDSHVLVGTCAQIGKRVHLGAGTQIGGVLEPPGALPVIVEDDAFVGGQCGIYEGTVVRERAVLAPGTLLSGSTPVFDLVRDRVYRREGEAPLEIPAGAVVVPGTRPVREGPGARDGLALYAPIVVKYRDARTDAAVALEEALR